MVSKLLEIWSGLLIPDPDPDFLPFPDPGVKKAPDSPDPDPQHWLPLKNDSLDATPKPFGSS
jgi:hypothetical protein